MSDEQPISIRQSVLATVQIAQMAMTENGSMNIADMQGVHNVIQGATAHALLYVGDQIREQVEVQRQQLEQQRLANVIAAFAVSADGSPINWDTRTAAEDWIAARISQVVTPESEPGR